MIRIPHCRDPAGCRRWQERAASDLSEACKTCQHDLAKPAIAAGAEAKDLPERRIAKRGAISHRNN